MTSRRDRSPVAPNSTKQQLSGCFDFTVASAFVLLFIVVLTNELLDALEAASKAPPVFGCSFPPSQVLDDNQPEHAAPPASRIHPLPEHPRCRKSPKAQRDPR